jgi:hypothetical protein
MNADQIHLGGAFAAPVYPRKSAFIRVQAWSKSNS